MYNEMWWSFLKNYTLAGYSPLVLLIIIVICKVYKLDPCAVFLRCDDCDRGECAAGTGEIQHQELD